MSAVGIAALVFAAVFGSALGGMLLRAVVPEHHITAESKDVVKLAMGLIATMAALVLGLLTGSAKSSFDTQDNEIKQMAANIIVLDRLLAQYGDESAPLRAQIKRAVEMRLASTWPEEGVAAPSPDAPRPSTPALDAPGTTAKVETIDGAIRALAPQTDAQRALQAQALSLAESLTATRWLLFTQASGALPTAFLVVLVFWLAVLFASFGLFAPHNATVLGALGLCALSVAGSLFLILEMNQPLAGLVKVSSAPLHYALLHLGQ